MKCWKLSAVLISAMFLNSTLLAMPLDEQAEATAARNEAVQASNNMLAKKIAADAKQSQFDVLFTATLDFYNDVFKPEYGPDQATLDILNLALGASIDAVEDYGIATDFAVAGEINWEAGEVHWNAGEWINATADYGNATPEYETAAQSYTSAKLHWETAISLCNAAQARMDSLLLGSGGMGGGM